MSKIQAKAQVQVIVEINTEAPWSADCTIGQLYKQASEEAIEKLNNLLNKAGQPHRIINAKVIGVITEVI